MVQKGILAKVGRGKYYKPKPSIFGNIGPDTSEIVKDLLYDDGILTGYVTNYTIWNSLGLTTQISNTIVIGTTRRHDPVTRHQYKVRYIAQPNNITMDNIYLLQLLDALKFIKKIPDTTIDISVQKLGDIITKLKTEQFEEIIKLSMKYPPRVRALLGAILESHEINFFEKTLKSSLNPGTSYRLGIIETSLKNRQNWNIE